MTQPDRGDTRVKPLEQAMITALENIEALFASAVKEVSGETSQMPDGERYHHGACDITFTWEGTDSIKRSVQAWITGDGPLYLEVSLLVSAWKDEEQPDGSGVRNSKSEQANITPIPFGKIINDQMKEELKKAYSTVSSWGQPDLTRTSSLPPLPVS